MKPTANQEGSNPTPVEVELKVREGTEIEFTEAYLKTASLAEIEQVSKESVGPLTEL